MGDDFDTLSDEFEYLASWCEGSSPLYERLCRFAADDDFLLDVAADHTPGQPAPQLLLAAVQDRLLAGDRLTPNGAQTTAVNHGERLGAYYGSIVDDPREPDDAVGEAFHEFVHVNEDDIRTLVSTRRCQTNSVRRCSALYPGFTRAAQVLDEEAFALLEVGSSAGLNLNWDRYAYTHHHEHAGANPSRRIGATDSPVHIETAIRGANAPSLPAAPPRVSGRVGLDVHPLDPADETDARWLKALVWPEHQDRRRVLDGALDLASEHPPTLVQGDAVTDLASVADRFSSTTPLLVFHTLVLYQFDDEARSAFDDAIGDLAASRDAPTYRLSGERPDPDVENGIQLRLTRVDDTGTDANSSVRGTAHLATFEQHGAWIRWTDVVDDGLQGPTVVHEDPGV